MTTRIGQLCVRAENFARVWVEALAHCANLDLRLPTLAEAMELAQTYDIQNVDENEVFWTSDRYQIGDPGPVHADTVNDAGVIEDFSVTNAFETVCVTTPTN